MPRFFITHVEPLHPQKGKEALFFIREQEGEGRGGRSHVVIKEIPHYFFTRLASPSDTDNLLAKLKQDPALAHFSFEKIYYSQKKFFVRARGSKEDSKSLPPPFICGKNGEEKKKRDPLGLNSPSQQLRWLYPAALQVNSLEEIPPPQEILNPKYKPEYASLESLVQDSYAVIDIETVGWQWGQDQIFMLVYVSPQSKIIFHELPFEEQEHQDFRLRRFASQEELGQQLTALIHKEDPLWIYGHNIMGFDQIKIRELTKAYFPATNVYKPITKSAQGLGKVITKGRFTLDTYRYSFQYLSLFANTKLETIAEFEKSISYEEQDRLVVRAKERDREAFEKLVDYCIKDGLATEETANRIKERVAMKTIYFKREPDSLCAVAKYTVAEEHWKRRHFLIKKTYEDSWKTYSKKRIQKKRGKKEKNFSLEDFKKVFLKEGFRKGFFEEVGVLYLTPFIAGCQEILEEKSPLLLEKARASGDPLVKFDLMQTINAELSYLIEEIEKILGREGKGIGQPLEKVEKTSAFYCLLTYHELKMRNPQELVEKINTTLNKTNQALDKHQIINQGNYFYFLKGEVEVERLENSFYGCYLGKGPALSLEKGRIIANPFGEKKVNRFVYQGFSLDKGHRSNFEKRVIKEVIERIFKREDLGKVKEYLDGEIGEFLFGKGSAEDYFIRLKTRTYFKNLLGGVLERSRTLDGKVKAAYKKILPKIGERFSPQTRKSLNQIVEECSREYAYPFLLECQEGIEHPYPPTIDLVCAGADLLLPASHSLPDREAYKAKVENSFQDFYKVLGSK